MGIQINGQTDTITAIDGSLTVSGADFTSISAGTTSIPSISPSGDSNTGIFFPSADTIAFAEGGVEALRIDSSGRLGIGTANPSQKLEVVGGEIKAGRVDSTNEGGQVSFGRATDNATGWYIDVYGNTSTPSLRFVDVSNSAVRATIDGSGIVTKPYQPAFMVRGDETTTKASGSKFAFTKTPGDSKVCFDRANNWSDANDRFTAPVAGVYQFTFGLYRLSATSSYFSVAPRVNGSQLSNVDTFIFFTSPTGETGNADDGMYGTFYMNLSANDYVELFMRDGSVSISIYNGHTFFGGHLIG